MKVAHPALSVRAQGNSAITMEQRFQSAPASASTAQAYLQF